MTSIRFLQDLSTSSVVTMWGRRRNTVTVEQQQSQSHQTINEKTMMMLISHGWSVFDGIKTFPENPDSLMSDINEAILSLEFSRATLLLENPSPSSYSVNKKKKKMSSDVVNKYDERLADEAFKAGCSALASGKLDEAFRSLKVSLSKCPPDKASAVTKLQNLISLTSQQLQRSSE